MEIVIEKTIKIPVAVIGNLLLVAARGFREEDEHNFVELDKEKLEFLSDVVTRGMLHYSEVQVKTWVVDELTHFQMEINDDDSPTIPT